MFCCGKLSFGSVYSIVIEFKCVEWKIYCSGMKRCFEGMWNSIVFNKMGKILVIKLINFCVKVKVLYLYMCMKFIFFGIKRWFLSGYNIDYTIFYIWLKKF